MKRDVPLGVCGPGTLDLDGYFEFQSPLARDCGAVLAWSVVMILQGLASMLLVFVGLRYVLGLGEGVNLPAMNRAMADWMGPRELGRQEYLCLLGVPLAVIFFAALIFARTPMTALIWLSLAIGVSMMPNAPYYSICSDLFPRQAGSATGIIATFFSASGIVSPLLTGWLSVVFGGFDAAIGALIGIVGSAVAGMILFARPDEVDAKVSARNPGRCRSQLKESPGAARIGG